MGADGRGDAAPGSSGDGRPAAPVAAPFATAPPQVAAPALVLPSSGGAIRGIGEKFAANPANGTASVSVPIAVSAGRSGFAPRLALSYDSGRGNGPFGFGWSLSIPMVTRRTDKGLPRYDDSDVFLLSEAEDLVPLLEPSGSGTGWSVVSEVNPEHAPGFRIDRFRPRVEGQFARVERWVRLADGDSYWRSTTRENVTSWYGLDADSRIADPADPARVFSWLLCRTDDGRGNSMTYEYLAENDDGIDTGQAHERHRVSQSRAVNRYPKRILYGNRASSLSAADPADAGWMFEVVFDYGEHDLLTPTPAAVRPLPCRADPFSSYRAGFEVRTYRLCQRVLMFHHFPAEPEVGVDCLVRSTDLGHTPGDAVGTFLTSVTQRGYRRQADGYRTRALPPVEFSYTTAQLRVEVREADAQSVANLPAGSAATGHQWADVDGDGLPGMLVAGGEAWYYKANLGEGRLGPLQTLPGIPAGAGASAQPLLLDLAGDGQLDVVTFTGPMTGFAERTTDGGWSPWRPFPAVPTVGLGAQDVRLVDLTGDGHADLLVAEDDGATWYASLAEDGFGAGIRLTTSPDADTGSRVVFADRTQSLHLADVTGDGLADLVRIRNGSVCYWPNLGYGRFGAKVTMDDAPWFDSQETFDQRRVRLADVDGSGVADLIYLAADGVRIYLNRSGNGWTAPVALTGCPPVEADVTLDVLDLLGTGTACLVWSSTRPTEAGRPLRYADLLGGVKPHLLERMVNNLGAETLVQYAPSTRFHLADRAAGRPWLTRLPFPVQVVERVETVDGVAGRRFVTRYAYHHGYFDGIDREFRGFGMVEQWDTEPDSSNVEDGSAVPPVLTRTWLQVGAPVDYSAEFWREPGRTQEQLDEFRLPDTVLPETLLLGDGTRLPHRPSTEELREVCRALKGSVVRKETFALDGSPEEGLPYQVVENAYAVELLQPMAQQPHAVCLTRRGETVTYHYERQLYEIEEADGIVVRLADPRVAHELVLDVDGFGNVRQGVTVAYGRRFAYVDGHPALPEWAAAAVPEVQRVSSALLTVNGFTNTVDEPSAYRSPLPCESLTYELVNVVPSQPRLLRSGELRALCELAGDGSHDLSYEDFQGTGALGAQPYRRMVEHTRSLYQRDDLAGPLPLGQLESLALPHETYRLALTDDAVASVYRADGADLLPDATAVLGAESGYVAGAADAAPGTWWVPSGRYEYTPTDFYLPHRHLDPFGNVSTLTYDAYDLLLTELRDPLDNLIAGENDYRMLAPTLITDPNGNRSAVAFDAFGFVAATAVMGKAGELAGDALTGFDPDPDDETVAAYFTDPLADPHALLGQATTRMVYDLFAFSRDGQAPVTATLARQTHVADLAAGQQSTVQHVLAYCDGFGREIQRKMPAEPGQLTDGGPLAESRWVTSGWTVFNNKGLPVRQYEPFFTGTPAFERDAPHGVSPIICYDPVGRAVLTVWPDHAWQKVVIEPWRSEQWDRGDTALVADPVADPHVGSQFQRLHSDDYLPTWYAQRIGGTLGPLEAQAATKTELYAATPSVVHLDSLGRAVITVAHNRFRPDGAADTDPLTDEPHPSRVLLDIEGNQREVVDAAGRTVQRNDYDLLGNVIRTASQDSGMRHALTDVTGALVRTWDERGHATRMTYDATRRLVGRYVRGTDSRSDPRTLGREILVERLIYGEDQPDDVARNLRTRVFAQHDGAGVIVHDAYDFAGNLVHGSRQLAADYKGLPDWSGAVDLEPEMFTRRTAYDAVGRPTLRTAADGSSVRYTYNESALLQRVEVDMGDGFTAFVGNIDYDAKGRQARVEYGNGTHTEFAYDPLTFRLTSLVTGEWQRLAYTYDPVGNITHVHDDAVQTIFFRNRRVEPSTDYTYDALYRLIEAAGREHLGQAGEPLSHPHDGNAMGTYVESYTYDAVGNLLRLRHRGSDPAHPGWTRRYTYDEPSPLNPLVRNNRLSSTQIGDGPVERYTHDPHGNMTAMPHLAAMRWNHLDQLQATARQVVTTGTPETTYYVYDAAGKRVRKVTETAAASGVAASRRDERIYLGELELFRDYRPATAQLALQRHTLHVHTATPVALVESRTFGDDGSPARLIRYQLGDHQGSSSIELDESGRVLTHEEYTPFGETSYAAQDTVIAAPPKRYRYLGRERDEESSLAQHGARYYAPWLGRWCSADPLGIADGHNAYGYARNNPVRNADPGGGFTVLALLLAACGQSTDAPVAEAGAAGTVGAPNSPPPNSSPPSPNAPPDTPMPPRPPTPTTQPPRPPTQPLRPPTPPAGAPGPTSPSPLLLAGRAVTGGLVAGAIAGMVVGPGAALRQPCDPAKCGLDFSEPPTDEDIEIMASLTRSPVDRLLASQPQHPPFAYELARKARPLEPEMPAELTRWPGDREGNDGAYIYRSIRDDDLEQLRSGGALRPKGTSGTVLEHVRGQATHFVSASETYKGAQELMHPAGIIVIDVAMLRAAGSRIKWNHDVLSDLRSQGASAWELGNARNTQEVLVIKGIPRSAIVGWLP